MSRLLPVLAGGFAAATLALSAGAAPPSTLLARVSVVDYEAWAFATLLDLRRPVPYEELRFNVSTVPPRQVVDVSIVVSCSQKLVSVTRRKRFVVRSPLTYWRSPTIALADSCSLSLRARRDFGALGRMTASIHGL